MPIVARLTASILPARQVSGETEGRMYALFERYYAATSPAAFHADLAAKCLVILLHDEQHVLRGFSTLAVDEFEYGGKRRRVVFSGDTIIHHEFWGEQALAFAWTELAGRLKAEAPDVPLYWFLISKGARTYRYLPAMARHFYPSWKEATPPEMQGLLDFLAQARFGTAYQAGEGVIRFAQSRGQLREPWLAVSEHELERPEVRFFLQRNPRHGLGEELACLTELALENMRPLARRVFAKGLAA
jgi:hypothetical protein